MTCGIKKDGKIKVMQKTFVVKDGVVKVCMFDRQARIDRVNALAKENGWKVVYTKE